MEEYIKIYHQDGLISYAGSSDAQVVFYTRDKKTFLDVSITNNNKPVSETNQDLSFLSSAHLEFTQFPFTKSQFKNLESECIEIPDEFQYSEMYNSDIFMSLGFGVTIDYNKIWFTKQQNDYYIHWNCIGTDINYYDERAKPNRIEVISKIKHIHKT